MCINLKIVAVYCLFSNSFFFIIVRQQTGFNCSKLLFFLAVFMDHPVQAVLLISYSFISTHQNLTSKSQDTAVYKMSTYLLQSCFISSPSRIRVQALNSLGAGPFSHSVKLKTKPLPPEPPRLECAVYSHQNLKLKWGDGTSRSIPTDSIQYHLQMEDKTERYNQNGHFLKYMLSIFCSR